MSIEFVDVWKAFGSKEILCGFDLKVQEGETLAIIGGSGSGKSVALKHIVRLLDPDRGTILVDGKDLAELDRHGLYTLRRNVGFVFQFAALFDSMSVADNVGMGLRRVPGMEPSAIADRVAECLGMVDMDGLGERFPSELSGGQKKRAGLARALATRPKYVLYDEPTTGLDPVTATVIDRLTVRTAEEQGVTGVLVTHDMASAYRVADRIAMLHEGRVRFIGTPEAFQGTEDPVVRGFIEGRPELLERAL